MIAEHCWFLELTDGTRFPFLTQWDDGATNPLTSVSGFDLGDHWAVQGPLDRVGPSGGPLLPGMNHHPLASGIVEEPDCWAVPKEHVVRVFSAPML